MGISSGFQTFTSLRSGPMSPPEMIKFCDLCATEEEVFTALFEVHFFSKWWCVILIAIPGFVRWHPPSISRWQFLPLVRSVAQQFEYRRYQFVRLDCFFLGSEILVMIFHLRHEESIANNDFCSIVLSRPEVAKVAAYLSPLSEPSSIFLFLLFSLVLISCNGGWASLMMTRSAA